MTFTYGENSKEIYLNDILIGSNNDNSGEMIECSESNLFLGSNLSARYFSGEINELVVNTSEGLTVDYDFSSEQGDMLLDYSGNQNHGTIIGANWNLIEDLTSNGETNSDNLLTTISDTINVTIVPVNDAPIMVDLQPQTMLEDDTLKLELEGTDVDGDDIYFVTESVEEVNASISIEGDSLIIIPKLDWNGLVDVPVHLFDGSGANDVSILELTVQPIDDPTVVVQNIPDAAFIENFEHEWTADLNSVFMDVDNELDFIAVVEDTTVIGFNIENDILQLFSEEALNGITDMIVSAYNPEFPEVITATDTFQISVCKCQQIIPVIEPILDVTMNEDDAFESTTFRK